MAGSSARWESDPLFSAAEVVQDSADRMESLYRLLMHEWDLVSEENKDSKLSGTIEYRKRDLVTAIETTKWQLEDFERAAYFAALSDETGVRGNARKQFVNAIREQIVLVEKSLEEISIGDSNRSTQSTNFNEPDAVGLELFISGGDSLDHHVKFNSENSIMKRFFNSNGTADEIIELEPEVHLQVNDTSQIHASNFSKDDKLWKFGPNHSGSPHLESSVSQEEGMLENGCKESDDVVTCSPGVGKSSVKYFVSKNRLIGYLFGLLNRLWFSNKYRFSGKFTKRRKDGELTDDVTVDVGRHRKKSFFSLDTPSVEQCKRALMSLTSYSCQGLNCGGTSSVMQVGKLLEALPRRSDQPQSLFQYMTFHMRPVFMILITVAILGFVVLLFG